MRTLVWKELRENLKWALLLMIVLGMAEMHGLYHTQYGGPEDTYYNDGITLCKGTFLLVTLFGSAAAGLVLGLVQILPELKRDQWAALLHRPVSRGVIFRGKVAGGLLLYALATLPPFLLCVLLVATPGNFASPFVPGMMLPGLLDTGAGVMYYFAAITLALQRGKWAGLKAFPLLAAVYVTHLANSTELFRVAAEAVALMAPTLCVAGWATMLHPERMGPRPWIGKVAFLAMVFYGACGLGIFADTFFDAVKPQIHSHSFSYVISDEGVPLIQSEDDDLITSVTGLDGNPVNDSRYRPEQIRMHTLFMSGISSYIGDSHGWKPRKWQSTYRETRAYLENLRAYNYPRLEQWFIFMKKQSFVCYLPDEKIAVSRLDARGFQPLSATPQPFPPEIKWAEYGDNVIFWSEGKASYLSLPDRTRKELSLPGEGPIFGLGYASSSRSGMETMSTIALGLRNEVAVYDKKGDLLTTLPYHQAMDRWGSVEIGLVAKGGHPERFYLRYSPSLWIDWRTRAGMPSYLEEMDVKGNLLRTTTLPPLPLNQSTTDWGAYLTDRLQSPAFFFGGMVYQKAGAMLGSQRLAGDLNWRLGNDLGKTKQTGLWVICLSLALAGLTFFWARRAGFPSHRPWAWTAFVFFFNVAGFITFRLAADWPRLAACSQCKRRRPIRDETCPHCGSAWPAPDKEGMEIIEEPAEAITAGAGV